MKRTVSNNSSSSSFPKKARGGEEFDFEEPDEFPEDGEMDGYAQVIEGFDENNDADTKVSRWSRPDYDEKKFPSESLSNNFYL